jgi:hypothetical protein
MAAMKRIKYLALSFLCLAAPMLGALDFQIPEVLGISGFGTTLTEQITTELPGKSHETSPFYGQTPRSDIMVESASNNIKAPSNGTIIYVQTEAPVKTIFSFPLGGALAVRHPESYLSLLSGLDADQALKFSKQDQTTTQDVPAVKKGETLSGGSGSGVYPPNCFGLRLFDAQSALWVNPVFLASWIQDRTSPVIRGAKLTKFDDSGTSPFDLSGAAAKEKRIMCVQGSYRIWVDAFDTIIPGSSLHSAPYRILVVLDGKSIIDTSFIAANCSEGGLSFLGNPAPSRETLAADGSYNIGQIMLARGEHDLQLQVSDYAGNQSSLKTLIIAY